MTQNEYRDEKRKEVQHRYYIVHRTDILGKAKEYRAENREKRRAYMREYMRGYRSGVLRRKIPTDDEN